MRLRGSIAVLLLCLAAPAVAEEPFTPFMSEGDEARVGAEQHPQILAEFGGAYPDELAPTGRVHEIEIVAAATEVQIGGGPPLRVWAYNGVWRCSAC